jgi:hypothetical protein
LPDRYTDSGQAPRTTTADWYVLVIDIAVAFAIAASSRYTIASEASRIVRILLALVQGCGLELSSYAKQVPQVAWREVIEREVEPCGAFQSSPASIVRGLLDRADGIAYAYAVLVYTAGGRGAAPESTTDHTDRQVLLGPGREPGEQGLWHQS